MIHNLNYYYLIHFVMSKSERAPNLMYFPGTISTIK